jgi:choloylglycine hydrolase
MKLSVLALSALFLQLLPGNSPACSVFMGSSSKYAVMGKSYDWHYAEGIALINKRNMKKTALVDSAEQPAEWVSKYGSLTYTQFGRDFPISGLNERGLAIEILWDFDSRGPSNGSRLPAVNEAQWVQYQLDTARSVAEVIASVKKVGIKKVFATVHYLACDSSGACASIEFDGDQVLIHEGASMPVRVLTNSQYRIAADFLRGFTGFGGNAAIPWGNTGSRERFVIAAAQLEKLDSRAGVDPAVSVSWEILQSLRDGDHSMWNLVHDLGNRRSHFRSLQGAEGTKDFDLNRFDLSCKSPAKILDLGDSATGDMTARFADYDPAVNRAIVELSGRKLGIRKELVDLVAEFPRGTVCLEN